MTSAPKRILVVDQDEAVLIALESLLENEGFETTTTWDMAEAHVLLSFGEFDLLIVGNHPPQVKAAELVRNARAKGLLRCIVLNSAASYPFEVPYLSWVGACAVVLAGEHAELLREIRECFEHPAERFLGKEAAG